MPLSSHTLCWCVIQSIMEVLVNCFVSDHSMEISCIEAGRYSYIYSRRIITEVNENYMKKH